ncbi:MAG: hypothetical protein AAFY56_19760 [Pseudomonadota bacterium]
MSSWRIVGLATVLLVGSLAATESQANALLGRWEREARTFGWLGFGWIEFTENAMLSDVVPEMRVFRYDFSGDFARVRTRFGETYIFQLVDGDRICFPTAKVQVLTKGSGSDETNPQYCFIRK